MIPGQIRRIALTASIRWYIVYHAWTQDRNAAPDRRDAQTQR